jgi:DNA polymerase-3 subunit alpha
MQIAQVLAGYTLGGADLLRRAMGKKKPEEMAKQRTIFVDGSVARGVDQKQAAFIFDLMEKFAGYGFNKSHSAAYALLSYQTGYLKAHYPAAFMAAVLSADMDHTDKVVTLIKECADIGLQVRPPDVNHSLYEFAVGGERTIRYGLGAVRGVGRGAVEELILQREQHGPYKSVEDLCRRLDLQKVNRRVLEALIRSGSLDGLGANRATLMQRLPTAMQLGDQNSKAQDAGQNDMFGLVADERAPVVVPLRTPELPDWSEGVRLQGERETLGLYLTGHPIGQFESGLNRFVTHRIGDLISDRPMETARFGGGKSVTVAGLIDEVKKRGPRTILNLDDRTGRVEVTLFEDVFQRYRDLVAKDALVLVEGSLRFDEFSDAWRLSAKKITELDKVREQQARRVVLTWAARADSNAMLSRLADILGPFKPGPCPVTVEYATSTARGALTLGPEWTVRASRELLEKLETLVGRGSVQVIYGAPPGGMTASFADGR